MKVCVVSFMAYTFNLKYIFFFLVKNVDHLTLPELFSVNTLPL